jgi:hypothetical protein
MELAINILPDLPRKRILHDHTSLDFPFPRSLAPGAYFQIKIATVEKRLNGKLQVSS